MHARRVGGLAAPAGAALTARRHGYSRGVVAGPCPAQSGARRAQGYAVDYLVARRRAGARSHSASASLVPRQ
jgi:hypothetical protein